MTLLSKRSASAIGGRPLRFGLLLAEHFTLSALATFVDTLRLASDVRDRSRQVNCRWDIFSETGRPIVSSSGLSILPTARLEAPSNYDYVVVVGGLLQDKTPIDSASIAFLLRAAEARVPLISLCTGTFILAATGLLSGCEACVSWFHLDEFREQFPGIKASADHLFADTGDRLTCSGGVSSADLAAHLVEKHLGLKLKTKAMEVLQIDRARSGTEPQAHKPNDKGLSDARVRRALLIMDQNVEHPVSIAKIAERLNVSTRTLERLFLHNTFQTPNEAYVELRLNAARKLLIDSTRSIIDIALATGFPHHSHFTSRFKSAFGLTPSALRSEMKTHVSQTL